MSRKLRTRLLAVGCVVAGSALMVMGGSGCIFSASPPSRSSTPAPTNPGTGISTGGGAIKPAAPAVPIGADRSRSK